MKKLLLLICFVSTICNAQDIIVKRDGTFIESKVLEVNISAVRYKKYNNLDGPTYTIPKSKIEVINFENGDKEDFGRKRKDSGVTTKVKEYKDWNTLYVQYNPSSFDFDVNNNYKSYWDASSSFSGLSIGYSHAFNLISTYPLYFETGIAIQYSFDIKFSPLTDDEYVNKGYQKLDRPYFFSLRVPLNLTYRQEIIDGKFAIAPFAGLYMKANFLGFVKVEHTDHARDLVGDNFSLKDDNWYIFSKSDMGDDYAWKSIIFGWQVGLNLFMGNKIFVGASYGSDFSDIFSYTFRNNPFVSANIRTFSATIGYTF